MAAKILCIEDEPELRETIVEELNDVGYETIQADNGRTGLAAITANHPDLVLCDINMPEMDGTQLLQNLRVNHPDLADMPFIFLTALADRSAVLNGKKLGADDYLTKPIDFELLIATVEARLGQVRRMGAKTEQQLVKLYRTVSGGAAPDTGEPAADGAPPPGGLATPPVTTEQHGKLVNLASANDGQVTAGRFQFIGLDLIRDEFADRWSAFETRIYDIAEKTIAKRIDDVDVFRRDESNNYIICFAKLSEAEASFKADRIAAEIREKILGECGPDGGPAPDIGVAAQSAAAEGQPSLVERASNTLRTEVHSVALSLAEAENSESVFDLVQARLDQAASARRAANESTLKEIFETCRIRQSSIELRNGNLTPFRQTRFDEQTQRKIDALTAGQSRADDLTAELNMLQLGQVAEQIYTRGANEQFVEIIDLRLSTLESRRHQERLLDLLESFDDPVRNGIAFKLTGIPEEIYSAKLAGLANIVRPYCRLVAIELDRPTLGKIDPTEMRAPIVACRFDRLSGVLDKAPAKIKVLVQDLHKMKVRFLVHGIPDVDNKVKLGQIGADLLSMW